MDIDLKLLGAAAFGALIGWYVYYINRYRAGTVQFSDLVTLIGIIGGGTVLALFGQDTEQFGAYGIGLFVGFFAYFLVLVIFVAISSDNFKYDWFLDGRRRNPSEGWGYGPGTRPTLSAMGATSVSEAEANLAKAQAALEIAKTSKVGG